MCWSKNKGKKKKSVYKYWLEKFGKEKADRKLQIRNEKASKSMILINKEKNNVTD